MSVPSPINPSPRTALEFVQAALQYEQALLLRQYPATRKARRTVLLAELGLNSLICEELAYMEFVLSELWDNAVARDGERLYPFSYPRPAPTPGPPLKAPGDLPHFLLDMLTRHAQALAISPELTAYLTQLPGKERERGERTAQALVNHPAMQRKSKLAQLNVQASLSQIPLQFEQAAQQAAVLLSLPQYVEHARLAISQHQDVQPLQRLTSSYGHILFDTDPMGLGERVLV
ncbi:hypothetical protein [Hymenobacter sediminicola]|uniref:Uncharacterized protein n=1 Tax=Hymenobacter sediminicola TaxID=2761579 RepID=A0A7G7W776_9BACT|nr:hypothetical protein [Hymenobacter sediminicola]QNH62219.1 hypothetical protein H4317_19120 [Hymenobacter sediminicola]